MGIKKTCGTLSSQKMHLRLSKDLLFWSWVPPFSSEILNSTDFHWGTLLIPPENNSLNFCCESRMDAFRKLQSETPQEQREPQLRFTAEAAVNLLQSFGLDKDDLEELLLYPEEQMSPAMLAQILWKIRAEKDQRAQSEANPESSGSPSGAAFKSCDDEDFTGRRSGLNDKGSSVKAQCSSVKTPKPLQKSKQLRSSKTSVEKPKLKTKPCLKSKVCKSAPLKKKKRTTDLKTVQTDGKNKIKSSVKRIAAAKPAKTTKKLDQKDQEKCPSVSGVTKPTVVHAGPSHSSRQFPTEVPRSLPTLAMIQDYAAETPRVFPHSCCLCGKNSEDMMVGERLNFFFFFKGLQS